MALWHGRGHVEAKADQGRFAAQLPRRAPRASWSATSAASRSGASASSRARSSAAGARSSASATPGSPRPNRSASRRQESRRRADAAGRRRACAADSASDADDRRAGQPLLRLCGDQPDRVPAGQAAGAAPQRPSGRSFARCPRNWAKACAKSPTPSCAPVWSCLPRKLPLAAAPPSLRRGRRQPIPVINRSE